MTQNWIVWWKQGRGCTCVEERRHTHALLNKLIPHTDGEIIKK